MSKNVVPKPRFIFDNYKVHGERYAQETVDESELSVDEMKEKLQREQEA